MENTYYDLSPSQMLLFMSQKYTLHKQVNNICTSVLTDVELDFDILKKAIEMAYERNDSLRMRVVKQGKVMKQYFEDHEIPAIDYLDFRKTTFEEMEKKLYKIAHKRISNFGKAMSKVYLMHSFDGRCGLFFVVSHMILDLWGISVFYKDVFSIYEAVLKGTDMPKPLGSYEKLIIDDLNYKNTDSYKKDREYFEELFKKEEPIFTHINGSDVLNKYREKHKNPNLRYAQDFSLMTKAENMMLPLPKELVQRMTDYCSANKVTMQSLVFLAYRSYLSRVNDNQTDISINTIVARRGTLQEKNAGGSRPHYFPFRTIFEENISIKKALELITQELTAMYRHAAMDPMEVLAMWKNMYHASELQEYTTTALTYQPVKLDYPGMKIETKWYGNGALGIPFFLTVMDGDAAGGLKFHYEYQTHIITVDKVQKFHSYIMKAIQAAITKDEMTIGELLSIE